MPSVNSYPTENIKIILQANSYHRKLSQKFQVHKGGNLEKKIFKVLLFSLSKLFVNYSAEIQMHSCSPGTGHYYIISR